MMVPLTFNHLLAFLALFAMRTNALLPIRVLTHNIRYATTSPFTGEKPWTDRRKLLLNELHYNTLYNAESFICLQEVLHQQLVDVMADLGDQWTYIGVGRDDGKEAGEYSPIIYRPSVWRLEGWKTVWLSETPDKPGKGWDAASVRIVTVGTFQHQASKSRVLGLCTHFDDQGEKSRTESAKLILKVINDTSTAQASSAQPLPVFLAGDLNSETSGTAYQILNSKNSTVQDTKELAKRKYGDTNTFTGFQDSTRKQLIDHVFVGPRGTTNWAVEGYSVLPNKFEDGVYNSDHRAVVGDVVLNI